MFRIPQAPTTAEYVLSEDVIAGFAERLQGKVIRPGDETYDAARAVWNGMIDRYPALIVRAHTVEDVVAGVRFARRRRLLLSVRGGGHNVAGHATNDGGLVLDLGPMNRVVVDTAARLAHVQGGATIADVDRETQRFGLAVPLGVVSETGIAGLTLGGGLGWLRNKYGASSDNLVEAEVVTAAGQVLIANESENSDLFWGLRGGGGNFGVVTRFTYRLHPLGPEVFMLAAFHDGAYTEEALRFLRAFTAAAPDEVSLLAFTGIFPPGAEAFPEVLHGRSFVAFLAVYVGPPKEGERVLEPVRRFRTPLVDLSGTMPFTAAQQFFDEDYPAGALRYYWKSLYLPELSDAAIARIAAYARQQPSPLSTIDIWHLGGAFRRLPEEATAFHGRHAAFLVNLEANWEAAADDEGNITWVRESLAALAPFSDGSRYLNFPGFQEEGEAMMRAAFAAKYQRLAAVKAKYDPTNLFRLNANIAPAAPKQSAEGA